MPSGADARRPRRKWFQDAAAGIASFGIEAAIVVALALGAVVVAAVALAIY